jgi:hypothetical protein
MNNYFYFWKKPTFLVTCKINSDRECQTDFFFYEKSLSETALFDESFPALDQKRNSKSDEQKGLFFISPFWPQMRKRWNRIKDEGPKLIFLYKSFLALD